MQKYFRDKELPMKERGRWRGRGRERNRVRERESVCVCVCVCVCGTKLLIETNRFGLMPSDRRTLHDDNSKQNFQFNFSC